MKFFILILFTLFSCNKPLINTNTSVNPSPNQVIDKAPPPDDTDLLTDLSKEGLEAQAQIEEFRANHSRWWIGPFRIEQKTDSKSPSKSKPEEGLSGEAAQIFQNAFVAAVNAVSQGTPYSGNLEFRGCGPSTLNAGFFQWDTFGGVWDPKKAVKECGYLVTDPSRYQVVSYFFSVQEVGPKDRRGCIAVYPRSVIQGNIQRSAFFCQKTPLKRWATFVINPDPETVSSVQEKDRHVSTDLYPVYEKFDATFGSRSALALGMADMEETRPKDLLDIMTKYNDQKNMAIIWDLANNGINVIQLGFGIKGLGSSWKALQKSFTTEALVASNGLVAASPIRWWELVKFGIDLNGTIYYGLVGLGAFKEIDAIADGPLKQNIGAAMQIWGNWTNNSFSFLQAVQLYNFSRNFVFEKMIRGSIKNRLTKPTKTGGPARVTTKEEMRSINAWMKGEGRDWLITSRNNAFRTAKAGALSPLVRPKAYGDEVEKAADAIYEQYKLFIKNKPAPKP